MGGGGGRQWCTQVCCCGTSTDLGNYNGIGWPVIGCGETAHPLCGAGSEQFVHPGQGSTARRKTALDDCGEHFFTEFAAIFARPKPWEFRGICVHCSIGSFAYLLWLLWTEFGYSLVLAVH